ncbi:MAG TPA: Ig-like domain-containing protein, partial [Jatrophihabitantaceae bacterium]|nr:Ig-like domain-containing protein [Jatrophihabitantaceae bacterium]
MTLRRVIWLLGACGAFVVLTPVAALARWAVNSTGEGRAAAQTIPRAATPTALATGSSITVSWAATTLSGGTAATGYIVRRYDPALVPQTILANCTSVTTTSCTENNVPAGTWTYTVQATRGIWVGAESPRSSSVSIASFTITASQQVKAGGTIVGGSLSGFATNDPITFRLDSTSGTVLTASISSVNASGSASGVTVTVPAGSGEGTHTVVAVGGSGAVASSNSFLFDSVGPTHNLSLASANGAYWDGTTFYFDPGVAGSFQVVDALADSGSGPASVTFPSFTANKWTASAGSAVSTPAGGPYTSNTYSWSGGAATPAPQTITGLDGVGNATGLTWTFTPDTGNPVIANTDLRIAPVGNTTTPGFITQGTLYYVYANASDAGSGIASVTANVSTVTTGQTAVPLVAGSYTVGGVTYGYRSAALTANAALSQGNKAYNATATDRVGQSVTSSNTNVVVDNTAPTGSMTAPANGSVVPASATVTSNSADTSGVYSVEFQFSVAGAGVWTTIATDTASPYTNTWDTSALTQGGSYDVRVITTDNALNVFTSTAVTVTVDRVAPAPPSAPVLAAASDSGALGDNVTNVVTPTFTGTTEAGTTVYLYEGTTQLASGAAPGGTYSIAVPTLTSGTHSIVAVAVDAAGNYTLSAATNVLIDTTKPTIAATDLQIAPVGNTTTGGFVAQGAQYYVYANASGEVGGSGVATVTANVNAISTGQTAVPLSAGSYSVGAVTYGYRSAALAADAAIPAGNKNYTGTATDVAGNATTTGNRAVAVENTAPTGALTAPVNGASVPASATLTSSSADSSSGVFTANFQYSVSGSGSWTSIGIDPSSPYSVTWDTSALTQGGSYDLRVVTIDNASNTFTSPTVTVTVDKVAPSAPSTPVLASASDGGIAGDNLTNDNTPTFTGTAEAGATVTIYDGGTAVGSATAIGGSYSVTTSTLADGAHTITATATDAAGNTSAASAGLVITVDTTAPAPTGVVLANGGVAGRIDTGDTGTITYSEPMRASTFCSAWADNATTQTLNNATVTISDAGGSDTLSLSTSSCTFGLGAWVVGDYVGGGPATLTNSTVTWNPT